MFLKLILGFEQPDSGKILVNKNNLSKISSKKLNENRKNIGYVLQDSVLIDEINVFDNIALPMLFSNISLADIEYRVLSTLGCFGLKNIAKAFPSSLTQEQYYTVLIVKALAIKPLVLLIDSPCRFMTYESILLLIKILNSFSQSSAAILLTTSNESLFSNLNCKKISLDHANLYTTPIGF